MDIIFFVLFLIVGVFSSLESIFETKKYLNRKNKLVNNNVRNDVYVNSEGFIETSDDESLDTAWFLIKAIVYVFSILIGLLTSQWFLFLVLILFSLFITHLLKKIFNKDEIFIEKFSSTVELLLVFLITINKFHLHIDFVKLIFN